MRNWILILGSFFLFHVNGFTQGENDAFLSLLEKGQKAFEGKDYDTCIKCYEEAMTYQPNNAWPKFAAARCYDSKKNKKKSFQHLIQAVESDWEDVEGWLDNSDNDFGHLKRKKRCWKKVQRKINTQQKEAGLDLVLREDLLQMGRDDQKYRTQIHEYSKAGKYNSPEVTELWKKQSEIDAKNLKRSEEIIAKYGYPSKQLVGKKAAKSIFLVIQHADLKYQEKYIALFKEAVKKGDLKMSTLALMIDRIEVSKGRPQIYGTQVGENQKTGELMFDPIVDEKRINKRRELIGLSSIESYAQRFNFEYKLQKRQYSEADFRKFTGGWDLVNIRDAETFEIVFLPKHQHWVEFLSKGKLRYNLPINICETQYQATDRGRIIFTPNLTCTKKCCDDDEATKKLIYHDVIGFELYDKLMFLLDTRGQIWEFKKKKYKKQKLQKAN